MTSTSLHGKYSNYRYCIVRECKNTSIKTPGKLWIRGPSETNMRNTWLRLAKKDPYSLSTETKIYFCEDHFDLENDMANYMQYKIMGSVKRIQMKPNCIPSRFDCQTYRNCKLTPTPDELQQDPKKTAVMPLSEDNKNMYSMEISTICFHQGPEPVPGDETEMEDEVPKVCRACLATEVRMFDVAAGGLQDSFEHVTGTELYTSDERPTQVCFVCCSLLQRFRAFCQMSRKAETYMTKLLKKGLKITEQEVSKRHRLMKPKLGVKKNSLIATHIPEDSNECATVEVKVEVENEVEDNNLSDSETEIKTEIGSEVKTGTLISERYPNRQNKTGEGLLDLETEGEIKIEIEEVDIEEFDPFEAIEHTTVRDETCCCLQCAEAFPSQRELLKHLQNHTQKKLKQANSIRRNVKAKRNKRNVKVESRCKYCNTTFAIKAQLMTHVATEHGFGEFSTGQVPKRRKPNILKKTSKHNVY